MDEKTVCRVVKAFIEESFVPIAKKSALKADGLQEIVEIGPRKFSAGSVFQMEMLIRILTHNRDRIGMLWRIVESHIELIFTVGNPNSLIDRTAVGLMRIMSRLVHYAV
jgi:hypothetical protein